MSRWLLELFFGIIVFLANIVQAITGFAGTALAMPPSIQLLGRDFVRPILNAIAIPLCLFIAIRHYKDIDWKNALSTVLFTGVGLVVGMLLEPYVQGKVFLYIYGGIVCLVAIYYFFAKETIHIPFWVCIILMFAAGIIHAIFVSGGPLLIIAARSQMKEKAKFRATLSFVWIILNSVLLTQDLVQQRFTSEMGWMLLILLPTVALSYLIGHFIFKKLQDRHFMKAASVLLFVSGVTLFF